MALSVNDIVIVGTDEKCSDFHAFLATKSLPNNLGESSENRLGPRLLQIALSTITPLFGITHHCCIMRVCCCLSTFQGVNKETACFIPVSDRSWIVTVHDLYLSGQIDP